MARIRSVHPEFWRDEKVGKLTIPARLLFVATWTMADDDGRLRWSPGVVRAEAFTYDELTLEQVAELMGEVETVLDKFAVYEVAGERYACIQGFREWQKPKYPSPSKLPPPPDLPQGSPNSPPRLPQDSGRERGCIELSKEPHPLTGSTTQQSYPQDDDDDVEDGTDSSPDRIRAVIELAATARTTRTNGIRNPTAYRHKVTQELLETEAIRVRKLIHDYPTAPDGILAAAVNGETGSLRYYREGA